MLNKERIKSLFLSAWYPNRQDAMSGLFVRKHAEAVALFGDVTVLYFHADPQITKFEIVKQHVNEHLREIIVYYPNHIKGTVGRFIKIINYFRANYIGYKEVQKDFGRPDIVHVNVLTRTGLLAYWLKLTQRIPYVITEHWSRYFSERNSYSGFFRRFLTKLIVRSSGAVMPVSEGLKRAMLSHKLLNYNYQVINNVVEDFFFENTISSPKKIKKILHVSCFDDQVKNISGILRATKSLSLSRNDFNLIIVGTGVDYEKIRLYTDDLEFPQDMIHFTGELTPQEVAAQFYQADFFVLFSNYENSPVVISESLACGKPVISTDVGGISEHVNKSNGILIPAADEKALLDAIQHMLNNHQSYDKEKITSIAKQKFSYESVSDEINKIYSNVINKV